MEIEKLIAIVKNLASSQTELEHVEFKENNSNPLTIGKNFSAIYNSIILNRIPRGYIIWGVSDEANDENKHEIVGTNFEPNAKKQGNEELKLWLEKHIKPSPRISFQTINIEGKRVVVLIIEKMTSQLSKFDNIPYIRIGTNTRKLDDFPEIEKAVWQEILSFKFETITSLSNLFQKEVANLLDLKAFYNLRRGTVPVERDKVFEELINCEMVRDNKDSTYDITNLGAILLAKNLNDFPSVAYKSPRVVVYDGNTKLKTISEQKGIRGYAVGFDGLHNFIMSKVKEGEEIVGGIRKNTYLYPELTVRELLANIIVHQDFGVEGMQPMVEIYSDRIEFTNPGDPIVDKMRFIDSPPNSRNTKLADELSKLGICERRGSGWDKIATEVDDYRFPAPEIEVVDNSTRVVLLQKKLIKDMTKEEQIWSVYLHTCLKYANRQFMTNTSIRSRFGIDEQNLSMASRLISQTLEKGLVAVFDEDAGTKARKYVPYWVKNNC